MAISANFTLLFPAPTPPVQQKYIASPVKQANIFLTLLREISPTNKTRIEIEGCISCLLSAGANDCFKVWRMNYKKQQLPSLLLLRAIGKFFILIFRYSI